MHISEKTQLVNALPKRNVPRPFCSEGEGGGGGVLRFDLHHQIKSVFFLFVVNWALSHPSAWCVLVLAGSPTYRGNVR